MDEKEKEDKGFVVKDRRKVSLDDLDKEEKPEKAEAGISQEEEKAKQEFEKSARKEQARESVPLPEVTFSAFVFSLSSSALVHLGEIPDPGTNQVALDLPLAKQIIDTLGMIDEKTRGNLDNSEAQLMKTVLYDLRMRFVQKSGSGASKS